MKRDSHVQRTYGRLRQEGSPAFIAHAYRMTGIQSAGPSWELGANRRVTFVLDTGIGHAKAAAPIGDAAASYGTGLSSRTTERETGLEPATSSLEG